MIPDSIHRFLSRGQAVYTEIRHLHTDSLRAAAETAGIPVEQMVRAVTLADAQGLVIAVLPYPHLLNFAALCRALERTLEPIPAAQLHKAFHDCDAKCCPPFAGAYGVELIVDKAVFAQPRIYLEPGRHNTLLEMAPAEFLRLHPQAAVGSFSAPPESLAGTAALSPEYVTQLKPAQVKATVEAIHELPALPATAARILEVAGQPHAGAEELGRVIETDPPLAAKVMQYANSPLYGFPGRIRDVKSAIARVLGFDFVLNLALGIAVGKTLNIPSEGPLGTEAYWHHAVHCAALVDRLVQVMPAELKVRRGTAYLAGLLHNLGILLLGEAFQSEFFLLNRFMQTNPERPMREIEQCLLGVGHNQIGGWLMQAWGLPEELEVAARHHHDEDYWDRHALYSQLILIADRALNRAGIGFDAVYEFPPFSLEMLGLTEAKVMEITESLETAREELDALAVTAA